MSKTFKEWNAKEEAAAAARDKGPINMMAEVRKIRQNAARAATVVSASASASSANHKGGKYKKRTAKNIIPESVVPLNPESTDDKLYNMNLLFIIGGSRISV